MASRAFPAMDFRKRQSFYGAAVVMICAAWESYVEGLVLCFYDETSPFRLGMNAPHHQLARTLAASFTSRFHTPNSDNVCNLLIQYTGYDPWPDWGLSSVRLSPYQTRQRVDEILKVRHSVAHGFSLPSCSWTASKTGRVRLTVEAAASCIKIVGAIVERTDNGMGRHISSNYGVTPVW